MMIGLDNVSLKIGSFSLKGISLTVRNGAHVFLMGPSGAGKTLVLETIAGLHVPDQGAVFIDGVDCTSIPPEQRRVGFVYQDYSLFPHYTVARNIAFGMHMLGKPRALQERIITELIDMLGISHLADRYPQTLSGGEQQRVALARALAIEPRILLLDEPFAAIDCLAREECMEGLRQVHREKDLTILQVSHSREEAYTLGDEVILLDQGSVLQAGSTAEVFSRPAGRRAATIAGFENIFEGTAGDSKDGILDVHQNGTTFRGYGSIPKGRTVVVCIRAGAFRYLPRDIANPRKNTVQGIVSSLIYTDYECRITIEGTPPIKAFLPIRMARSSDIRVGVPIRICVDRNDVLFLDAAVPA
jgi:molybdate/tungstate transport system ATP-binding protein